MATKTIKLAECKEGDILASDLFNASGVILAAKDTALNEYIIEKLEDHAIRDVLIIDREISVNTEFRTCYADTVNNVKKVFQELVSGNKLNYQNVSCVADKIFDRNMKYDNIVKCLGEVRNVDEYTYTHSVNVAFYSMMIAKWLEFSEDKIKLAIKSGLLHDVGKIKIPHDILNKKGILTREEFEIIKEHTILGFELLKDMDEVEDEVKSAVLLHHERINGSGYPYQFNSESLNIYSRIVAVADVFDAMTSDRVYKGRSTPFEVFEMFSTVGMGQFDTKILKRFLNSISSYLVGSKVLLNSGEIGEVVYVPLQSITYPIVRVESEYLDLSQRDQLKIVNMLGSA